ncbi:hypothetical protein F5Y19DRAFT_466942 [Xylariaceae sp. FL1651]|nr:hypothetical protein F5Y19DRAFT_466942 [Xylariaceae sp. FL1651]
MRKDFYGLKTTISYRINLDGVLINIPDASSCWYVHLKYACGCACKTVQVKQGRHSRPCWLRRCDIASATHMLVEKCHRCDMKQVGCELIK